MNREYSDKRRTAFRLGKGSLAIIIPKRTCVEYNFKAGDVFLIDDMQNGFIASKLSKYKSLRKKL